MQSYWGALIVSKPKAVLEIYQKTPIKLVTLSTNAVLSYGQTKQRENISTACRESQGMKTPWEVNFSFCLEDKGKKPFKERKHKRGKDSGNKREEKPSFPLM